MSLKHSRLHTYGKRSLHTSITARCESVNSYSFLKWFKWFFDISVLRGLA